MADIKESKSRTVFTENKPVAVDIARSEDDKSWLCFEKAMRSMLPSEVAVPLLNHGRAHYFASNTKRWRTALRESESNRRQNFSVGIRGLQKV